MKKYYKLIINFKSSNEQTFYFNKMTRLKLELLNTNQQYILFVYEDFLQCYLEIKNNLSYTNQKHFNNNISFYCERN